MANNFKQLQAQNFTLAGAGSSIGDTSLILSSMLTIDGIQITMTDIGSKGYFTADPGNGSQEEAGTFTGITQNVNGTATLTGVSHQMFEDPYTETSGMTKSHTGGVSLVLSNTAGFYQNFLRLNDSNTVSDVLIFTNPNYPQMDVATPFPTLGVQLATKAYVDSVAIAGSPKATDTVYGISKLSVAAVSPTDPIVVGTNDGRVPTQNENDALVGTSGTAVSSSNKLVDNADTIGTGKVLRQGTSIKFGGSGSDGSLSISSGVTNIDLGNASVVTKNYTSISITGTASVTFTNPNVNGTIVIFKSQGNVDITSSANPTIDLRNIGATGSQNGNTFIEQTKTGSSGGTPSGGIGGIALFRLKSISGKYIPIACGAGGLAGTSASGGMGGGALYIECGGFLNFGASSVINAAGANGNNSASNAGSGGGAGGSVIIIYNSLTTNSGTITLTGGNGGNGGNGGGGNGGSGGGANRVSGGNGGTGGSGGSSGLVGNTGLTDDGTGGTGGTGGSGSGNNGGGGGGGAGGWKLITQNIEFA